MQNKRLLNLSGAVSTFILMSILLSSACAAPAPTTTPPAEKPKEYKIQVQASPTTSDLHKYDVDQADIFAKIPGVKVAVLAGEGSQIGVNACDRGEVQMAMGGPNYMYRAMKGILDQPKVWGQDFRVLWAYTSSPMTIFVTTDSGITSLSGLTGKRFGMGTGSEAAYLTSLVIELAGAKPDYLWSTSQAVEDAILNRQCIGYTMPGAPMAIAKRVEASMPITILPVTPDIYDKALQKYGSRMFTPGVIPAGTYKGQDKDVPTFENPLVYITTKNGLDPDIVYKLADVLYQNRAALAKGNPRAEAVADWPKATIAMAQSPLHVGIVKYLQEKLKMTVPKELIPPEYK